MYLPHCSIVLRSELYPADKQCWSKKLAPQELMQVLPGVAQQSGAAFARLCPHTAMLRQAAT